VTLTSLAFWSMLGGLTSIAFTYFDRESVKPQPLRA
jgi:hypothetical protein